MPEDPETGGWTPDIAAFRRGTAKAPPAPAARDDYARGPKISPPAAPSEDDADIPEWTKWDPVSNAFSGIFKGAGRAAVGIGGLATDLADLASRATGTPEYAGKIASSGPAQAFKRYVEQPGGGVVEKAGIVAGEVAPWLAMGPERLMGESARMVRSLEGLSPKLQRSVMEAAKRIKQAGGPEFANPTDVKLLERAREAMATRKVVTPTTPLGNLARSTAGGGIIGAAQPADTPGQRLSNAAWGAALGGALRGLGIVGAAAPAAAAVGGVQKAMSEAISIGLAEALMHHIAPGSGFAFWTLKKAFDKTGMGEKIAEALPHLIGPAGSALSKAPASVVGGVAAPETRQAVAGRDPLPPQPGFDNAGGSYDPDYAR